ncbi:molybdenum cofactor cytidylyltransferase [Roseibium hamelinense]|uniref:Molybdenum cofactor cytidylyltransferase n=1 Tax=Roseibium hamelinense TaxID=150831 RepID=A0A562T277_9HYPH|nr:molybdopterin-binding/glycosyltransferase family 2 protein [Roseibium hamelinense]MTI44578.1 4-diphosphocytidyl-2C-methyl-D-erythritol kinase [Roseibium hamelinense]TWI87204.1 molybdenum cofactor cytidylyltransferase [Roseibium hamelinense]
MKFGPQPVEDAQGCILAHATKLNGTIYKKGRLLSSEDIGHLKSAGISEIVVARLEPTDITEDLASCRLAIAAADSGVHLDEAFTGRVNLFADHTGLLVIDEQAINAANRVDPSVTIATLPNYSKVEQGRMIATAKIIPFAVPDAVLEKCEVAVKGALKVLPFSSLKFGLVATTLDHLKPATMDKTRRVFEQRLSASGSSVVSEIRTDHEVGDVSRAITKQIELGAEALVLFGASAVVDRDDVLPKAIIAAGGSVDYFGMPVDPGNLLLLGSVSDLPVIGAPGCARSPKENGFDWVLDRLLAGVQVSAHGISGMGVGGLLMEITSRPQPRLPRRSNSKPKIAGVLLAAGKSRRMGAHNKLLATLEGETLVKRTARHLTQSGIDHIVAVTGYMAEEIEEQVAGIAHQTIYNPDFEDGMASSIRTGITALPRDTDAVMIVLGDMPFVTPKDFKALVNAYRSSGTGQIVLSMSNGQRGNPVLWDSNFFPDLQNLSGDTGARHLIGEHTDLVVEVEIGSAAHQDLDTPADLEAVGGELPSPEAKASDQA